MVAQATKLPRFPVWNKMWRLRLPVSRAAVGICVRLLYKT